MARLHKKPGNPYWHLDYIDETGHRRRHSLGLRIDSKSDTRKARAKLEAIRQDEDAGEPDKESFWEQWVPAFLATKYRKSDDTLVRYTNAWEWLATFFEERKIRCPAHLRLSDLEGSRSAKGYVDWRLEQTTKNGKHPSRNTVGLELTVLGAILREAKRLEFVEDVVTRDLRFDGDPPREKSALTDEQINTILTALAAEPPDRRWMLHTFLISLYTGCRLSATQVRPGDILFRPGRRTSLALREKGGQRFSVAVLFDQLNPVLRSIRESGKALEIPKLASKEWRLFFNGLDMPDVSFHCLRVTFITRACLHGVRRDIAKTMVRHASDTVHEIYQKLDSSDVEQAFDEPIPTTFLAAFDGIVDTEELIGPENDSA